MVNSSDRVIQKILIVGNAASGKTRLARRLAQIHRLPITHVDSIQFLPGMKIRPLEETRKVLMDVERGPQWIIDGHGPLDQLENRFKVADRIVFVDLPMRLNYFWLLKRQIKNIWSRRPELPEGCDEISFQHSRKMIQTMWKMNKQMAPELRRIFSKPELQNKVIRIESKQKWKQIFDRGLD